MFVARLIWIAIAVLALGYFIVDVGAALYPWLPGTVQQMGSVPFYTVWIIAGAVYVAGWPERGAVRWRSPVPWSRRDWLWIAGAGAIGLASYAPLFVRVLVEGATPPRLDFLGGGVVGPFVEEWVFRGLVWNAIAAAAPTPRAGLVANLVGGSLLFGLFHLSFEGHSWQAIANVVPHAMFGGIMGVMRWRARSVLPGALVHLAGNLVARLALP